MAKTNGKNGSNGSNGSPSNGKPNGKPHRYGRHTSPGQTSVDPATRVADAAPNFGRDFLPQIITFSGMQSTISHIYKNPDEAIRHSAENARFMRNDCSIMECLEARQRATALLNWHLEPEDAKDEKQKELATDLTAILAEIVRFTEYRRNLMEAVWTGRTAIQNKYERRIVRGKSRLCIRGWTPINGDKLAFRYDDGSGKYDPNQIGIRVGGAFSQHDALAGDRKIEATEFGLCYFLEPWERSLLTVHKHMIEDGAFEDPISAGRIHGVGVRDRIYWTWFQKQQTMAQLMEVIERTGTGFTIYYYQYGNAENKAEMLDVAQKQAPSNVILMPRMSEDPSMNANGIERIEPSTAGIDAMKSIIHEFFGHQIKRYILGQILSSESAATGLGSGVADLHQDTFLQIVQYDAINLEETITNEVVEYLKSYNFAWARDIRVKFKIDTKENETEKKLAAFKSAWDMGCRLKAQDVMDVIGASMPDEDDEVLQNPAMQQQQRLWEQAHPQEGDMGPGGGVVDENGQEAPEGSVEDMFGPLAGELGGGNGDGGDGSQGGDAGGQGGPGGGGGGSPPPGGPPGAGPQRFAKAVRSSPGQQKFFDSSAHRAAASKYKPELHPRDNDGKFAEKGTGHVATAVSAPGGIREATKKSSPGQKMLGLEGDAAEDPRRGQEQPALIEKPKAGEQPFALNAKPVRGKTTIPGSGATKQKDLFAGRGDAKGQTSFFDDVDPAAKNVGDQGSIAAPKDIGPGDSVTIPASNTFGQFEAEITDEGGGRVGIRQKGSKDSRPIATMHRNQLSQFLDDLNGVIHGKPDSASESINHVLAGRGKFLGRGNDGLAFDAGNGQVVKASSDIPFHWNNGLRDNHEGRNILQNQVKVNEHLRAAGVPGLLPQELHEHGGRTFVTMPKVDTEAKLTPEHVQQLRNTLNKMHDAGYALKDQVQVGVDHEGNARIFDTGAVKKLDKNPTFAKDDMRSDEHNLNYLIKKHGHDEVSLNYERDYGERAGHTENYLTRLENNPDKPANLEYLQHHRDSLVKAWEGVDDDTKEFLGNDHADTLKRLDAQIAKHSPEGKLSPKEPATATPPAPSTLADAAKPSASAPSSAESDSDPHLSRAREVLARIPKVSAKGLSVQLNGEVSEEHAGELLAKLRAGGGADNAGLSALTTNATPKVASPESPVIPAKQEATPNVASGESLKIAGMSAEDAAKLAVKHGNHTYEDALAKIKARPSAWAQAVEGWDAHEKQAKKSAAKEKRDANWKPNEAHQAVLDAVGKSRTFTKSQDMLMWNQHKKATQQLIDRGILDRVDSGREVSYRLASEIAKPAEQPAEVKPADHSSLVEAKSLLKSGKLPALHKSLLKSAVERAEAGDHEGLSERVAKVKEQIASQDAKNEVDAAEHDKRIARISKMHGHDLAAIDREISKAQSEYDSMAVETSLENGPGAHSPRGKARQRIDDLQQAREHAAKQKPAELTPEDRAGLPDSLKDVNPAFPSEVEKLKGIAAKNAEKVESNVTEHPPAVDHLALATEARKNGENISATMRRHGLDPVKDREHRTKIAEYFVNLPDPTKKPPSEARAKAMERSKQVNAEKPATEQAEADKPAATVDKFRPDIEKDSIWASGNKRSAEGRLGFGTKSVSAAALKGANAVWHHQGDPNQTRFNAAQSDAGEWTKGAAAEMEAALDAGYKFTNHRAGKLGTVWLLEKDGRVLTERGAKSLLAGTGKVDLPAATDRETAGEHIKAAASFIRSLPESTQGNFGALSAAINRSPLGEHIGIDRDRNGKLRLFPKGEKNWYVGETESGHDADGNWHRDLDSNLPRFLAKLDHMAANDINKAGHWTTHDRNADEHARQQHPIAPLPKPQHSPALQSAIEQAHQSLHEAGLAEKPAEVDKPKTSVDLIREALGDKLKSDQKSTAEKQLEKLEDQRVELNKQGANSRGSIVSKQRKRADLDEKIQRLREKVKAEKAASSSEQVRQPEETVGEKPKRPFTLADVAGHHKAMRAGELNAAQIKEHFDHYTANDSVIREELKGKTVAELKEMGAGGWHANSMKKAELIDDLATKIAEQYHVGESLQWNMSEKREDALRRQVHAQTDEHVKKFVDRHAAAQAEYASRVEGFKKALENPETLEEFHTFAKKNGIGALSPEQLATYDDLRARARREKDKANKATVAAFHPGTAATGEVGIVEGHHKKRNAPTYTVTVENHLGDNWDEALSRAKRMGGNYVNARIAKQYGATPGFQFFDKKSAEDFAKVLGGETVDTSEQVQQRKIEAIENAADRLAALAESTHAKADEQLNKERQTNTHRRAEHAASAEATARNQKALAETMERLSAAMKEGKAHHLEGIKNRAHVEELNAQLRRARWARMDAEKANTLGHDKYEEFRNRAAEAEDIKHAEYPYPKIWPDHLRRFVGEFKDEPGLIKIGQRLLKSIEGESPYKGTVGKMKVHGGQLLNPKDSEAGKFVYGLKEGQRIRVHSSRDWKLEQSGKGRGPFYTADAGKSWGTTPDIAVAAAVNRGHELDVVDAPQEKAVTITDSSEIADFATAAKKLKRHSNRSLRHIGEELASRIESYNRMRAMDIKGPSELRAALRDYLPLRTKPKGEDKIKKMERELTGSKIEGFFPTPAPLVERMLDAADIQPGHSVLEPSAGKGDILDAIRERHPDASTSGIEPHSSLRDIIEAKGHALVDRDFIEHKGDYDRIVMNPPFERGQDAEHVRHAYDRLKPGGRLVAIMSNGPFFRSDKKAEEFRNWLDTVDGSHEELPEGSFAGKDAFRQTGVNTRLVVIDKPKDE